MVNSVEDVFDDTENEIGDSSPVRNKIDINIDEPKSKPQIECKECKRYDSSVLM